MSRIVDTMIPDSISTDIERWEQDEGDSYRLTLLHKNKDRLYCFLSGNMQEVAPEQRIDLGMTIAISKRTRVRVHYDGTFHQRKIPGGHYLTFSEDTIDGETEKAIPFRYERELPSVIVERNLKQKLTDYIERGGETLLQTIEHYGDHTLARALYDFRFGKKWREMNKEIREARKALRRDITFLFHEERSPSTFIQPQNYLGQDRKKASMFTKQTTLPKVIAVMPIIALAPLSAFEMITEEASDAYENKFGESKEEEAQRALSEFAMANPRTLKGFNKFLRTFKHAANMGIYATQAAITGAAYAYTWPIISYPLIASAVASGATMAANLVRSRGRDSSGIISTIIEKSAFNKLD